MNEEQKKSLEDMSFSLLEIQAKLGHNVKEFNKEHSLIDSKITVIRSYIRSILNTEDKENRGGLYE